MFNPKELWKSRFQLFIKETRRYMRLIFNDHFKFAIILLIGGGAFYYQKWLNTLPDTFPAAIVISLVIAMALTVSPVRTFIKEADLVFLLPLENKLAPYFKLSMLYSFIIQIYILLLIIAGLAPLYFHQYNVPVITFLLLIFLIIVIKAWNILMSWRIQYFIESYIRKSDIAIRFVINATLVYFLLVRAQLIFPIIIVGIMTALLIYYDIQIKNKKTLKWELLVDLEARRMMTFYRIANMFTDVPKLKDKVKRRGWISWITNLLPFKKESTFYFLYIKAFFRSSDYFGIYVRLFIISGALIYVIPFTYSKIAVMILFLYLTGFQILSLWRHHISKIWISLYPVSINEKRKAFLSILFWLLTVQAVTLSLFILFISGLQVAAVSIVSSMIFNVGFVFLYCKKRLN